ncbi:MAG: TIGR01777 family protein [Candidatus Puniceispirillum sp. TMED52]|nr:MAG: TIGR01777 family protein [Candidatus Puniceispirillum sp. TMED52]
MKVFVTGGTGLIGRALVKRLLADAHHITILTRQSLDSSEAVTYINSIDDLHTRQDIVINLAGAGLADRRWSPAYKKEIRESRIDLTQALVSRLRDIGMPNLLISGSAIGIYGESKERQFSETDEVGSGFSAEICRDWEASVSDIGSEGTRCVLLRTGVVLDKALGAYPQMTQSFRFGLASWMGQGDHWLSWIHLADMVGAIRHCIQNEAVSGPVNMTAPNPVTHRTFSDEVRSVTTTVMGMGMPEWVMRLMVGEMADELLLTGQRVMPTKLLSAGYEFRFGELKAAIAELEAR